MGFGSGALFTSAGCQVTFLARTKEKAQAGLASAIEQVRSASVGSFVTIGSYEIDLEQSVAEADLIFEAVAENFDIKAEIFEKIDQFRKDDSIIATVSSGLSITKLAESRNPSFQQHFLGLHFFNPPNVIVGTEIIPGANTNPTLVEELSRWCEENLQRVTITAFDTPGFAGNRIGFKVLNEVAQLAEHYGPLFMDYIIGPYSGRALPPLATIDLVGWDIHKAIVTNVVTHVSATEDEAFATYQLPTYMEKLISAGTLGNKSGKGFFKKVDREKFVLDIPKNEYVSASSIRLPKLAFIESAKFYHRLGKYREAMKTLVSAEGEEAKIAQKVLSGYISYALHRIGEVTATLTGIDLIMGMGFNWAPPGVLIDMIGAKETLALLESSAVPVPRVLKQAVDSNSTQPFFSHPTINVGKFFVAR